jgi:hypothetical protein
MIAAPERSAVIARLWLGAATFVVARACTPTGVLAATGLVGHAAGQRRREVLRRADRLQRRGVDLLNLPGQVVDQIGGVAGEHDAYALTLRRLRLVGAAELVEVERGDLAGVEVVDQHMPVGLGDLDPVTLRVTQRHPLVDLPGRGVDPADLTLGRRPQPDVAVGDVQHPAGRTSAEDRRQHRANQHGDEPDRRETTGTGQPCTQRRERPCRPAWADCHSHPRW